MTTPRLSVVDIVWGTLFVLSAAVCLGMLLAGCLHAPREDRGAGGGAGRGGGAVAQDGGAS